MSQSKPIISCRLTPEPGHNGQCGRSLNWPWYGGSCGRVLRFFFILGSGVSGIGLPPKKSDSPEVRDGYQSGACATTWGMIFTLAVGSVCPVACALGCGRPWLQFGENGQVLRKNKVWSWDRISAAVRAQFSEGSAVKLIKFDRIKRINKILVQRQRNQAKKQFTELSVKSSAKIG